MYLFKNYDTRERSEYLGLLLHIHYTFRRKNCKSNHGENNSEEAFWLCTIITICLYRICSRYALKFASNILKLVNTDKNGKPCTLHLLALTSCIESTKYILCKTTSPRRSEQYYWTFLFSQYFFIQTLFEFVLKLATSSFLFGPWISEETTE